MLTLAAGRTDPLVILRIMWLAMLVGLLLACGIGALAVGTGSVQPTAFPRRTF